MLHDELGFSLPKTLSTDELYDEVVASGWKKDPPVAAVGWMEREAVEAGLDVEVESEVLEMVTTDDETIAEPSKTMIKIIAERSTKQTRGCVAIGNQASEVINLAALAIQSGIGTREIERLMLIHPSALVAFQRCVMRFQKG